MTETEQYPIVTWLNSLDPADACDKIEAAVSSAIQERELAVVPGLIAFMCRYDAHRAGRLHRALLDALNGKVTLTLELEAP